MGQMNFSWVLHGALAGAEGPARVRDLLYLKQQGIGAIVRMEARTISGERADLTDLYEPVPDFSPPTIEQIQRMVLFIQEQIETQQRPVAVTCHAGIGRTGTLLACYLVHEGNSPDNAVSKIRELRPGSIQTREQEDAVHRYAEWLKPGASKLNPEQGC